MDEATRDERSRSGILAGQLGALGAAFRARLARDREALAAQFDALGPAPRGQALRDIELAAHKLHGTAAMFGYGRLGAAAGRLERAAHHALAGEVDEALGLRTLADSHAELVLAIDAALAAAPPPDPQTK